ncbi:hypothetical protein [Caldalkalibacillus thermarum]|uniref:hypothetical protein n=1 Tax=Caldalkalibacillus thermarum TaxID=296745 RepID=UPI0016678567|nr:hypothetical protein [Caldalkalibacillus thermarum]
MAYNDYMHSRSFYNVGSEVIGQYGKVWEAVVEYAKSVDGPKLIGMPESVKKPGRKRNKPIINWTVWRFLS